MKKLLTFITTLLFTSLLFAATFTEGKDFEVITSTKPQADSKTVEVVEFFSYGCPWCQQFDPVIAQWEKKLPKGVEFKRIHVTFESGWNNMAKAFYTAEALGLVPKINNQFFDLAQKQRSKFTEDDLVPVFEKQGVDKKRFLSTFRFSTGLNTKVMHGENLMKDYQVMSVPSIVVGGKYMTNSAMARGDASRFIQTVKYLIKKVKSGK